jgi:hypothetical protein
MNRTATISLPRKHFGFDVAVEAMSATAGLHTGPPHVLLTITEPTKAETTP